MNHVRLPVQFILSILSLFYSTAVHAELIYSCTNNLHENLVPNPGFESYTLCPDFYSELNLAAPWYPPTAGTSDYFNACAGNNSIAGVPDNFAGHQTPHGGQGYTGAYMHDGAGVTYREYQQTPLLLPLVAGHVYTVSFWVSLATSYSDCAVDNIGAYFSTAPATLPHPEYQNLPVIPQVRNPIGNFLTSPNWTLIEGTFTATGSESYLTIGSFADDANTPLQPSGGHIAYYYFDDISVNDTTPCNACTNGSITIYCPDDIVVTTCSNCVPVAYQVFYTDTACDNCATLDTEPPSGTCFLPGTTTVTNTVTDSLGNTDVCTFTVTIIQDTNPPVVTFCPTNISICIPVGYSFVSMPDITPDVQAYSPSGTHVTVTQDIPHGNLLYGDTNITITVADACGDATNINVFCSVKSCCLEIECPTNRTIMTCSNGAPVHFTVNAIDICTNSFTITSVPPSGSIFPFGTTYVTNTAVDALGHTDICTFAINVYPQTNSVAFNCLTNEYIYIHADTNGCGLVPDETSNLMALNQNLVTVTQDLAAASTICSETNLTLTGLDACGITHTCNVHLVLVSNVAISYNHNDLYINWRNSPSAQLQLSTDLFHWTILSAFSPYFVTNAQMAPSQFYRLMYRTN